MIYRLNPAMASYEKLDIFERERDVTSVLLDITSETDEKNSPHRKRARTRSQGVCILTFLSGSFSDKIAQKKEMSQILEAPKTPRNPNQVHQLVTEAFGYYLNEFGESKQMDMRFPLQYPERYSNYYEMNFSKEGSLC
mgnify:CR=1 FL=1